MGNVYIWNKDGRAVCHASLEAAAQLDGLSRQPDRTVTEQEFSEAGGLVRVFANEIVLGKFAKEEEDEAALKRIAEIDARFAEIEREIVRPMTACVRGNPDEADTEKLERLDEEARELRAERAERVQSLEIPF